MGFWPFGGGKKSRVLGTTEQSGHDSSEKENTDPAARTAKALDRSARHSIRRNREESLRKLSNPRVETNDAANITALPYPPSASLAATGGAATEKGRSTPVDSRAPSRLYQQQPLSQTSIGAENFSVVPQPPTLFAKRDDYNPNMTRRKSSKRKAEDYAREREVKAMSSPIPIPKRPSTYSGSGPLSRDTRSIPGGMNRNLQRPASEVSLPLPDNISGDLSNQNSFKIGMLSALSPRPTLKYNQNPRTSSSKQAIRPSAVQQILEEEDASSMRRIDDLADDLDAGGLRELMERDRRRKERKKEADKIKLQRKLQRRAERQREEEETLRRRAEEYVSQSQAGTEETPGKDSHTSRPSQDFDDTTGKPDEGERVRQDPFAEPGMTKGATSQAIRNPFEDERDLDVMRDPSDFEDEEPPLPVKSHLRKVAPLQSTREPEPSSAVTISPPSSPIQRPIDRQSTSQASLMGREPAPDIPENTELERRNSDQSGQQQGGSSWTSFFRRGGRRKPSLTDRGRNTPSEFSNTSRESFARKQPPPIVPPRSFRRSENATPQRTMSKFREDLPELPLSPPDSRVQSPITAPATSTAAISPSTRHPRQSLSGTLDARSVATSLSNPMMERGRSDSRLTGRQSLDADMSGFGNASMALSQSLASVDSEGSWLSGRISKRASAHVSTTLHEGRTIPAQSSTTTYEPEDAGLADDEYLNRLSPPPTAARRESGESSHRKASSTLIDLQREGDQRVATAATVATTDNDEETWHTGVGRQATIVRQPSRAKSKEGLLKEAHVEDEISSPEDNDNDNDEEGGTSSEDMTPYAEAQQSPIMRARSVEYKGHVRHISAGSARLLDIKRSSQYSTDTTPPRSPGLSKTLEMAGQKEPEASMSLDENR